MEKECVLVSGGLDSCVLLWEVARERDAHPVYVRNGLAWEDVEVEYARRFVETVDSRELRVLDLPIADVYGDHWSVTSRGVPGETSDDEEVELPGRNILLLSKTAVYCALNGIHTVSHATLGGNPFPDSTPEFFDSAAETLSTGLDHGIRIRTPYSDVSKREVVRRAHDNGVRLDLTFSCIDPVNAKHCGDCNKCAERHREFVEAGVEDPTEYAGSSPPVL